MADEPYLRNMRNPELSPDLPDVLASRYRGEGNSIVFREGWSEAGVTSWAACWAAAFRDSSVEVVLDVVADCLASLDSRALIDCRANGVLGSD